MRNRLHSICPYFAMFPEAFVRQNIESFTKSGDYILDPFSGRGTTILESILMGRKAASIDINPVAFCISGAKAEVPSLISVQNRIINLESRYKAFPKKILEEERNELPPFFKRAFYHTTLLELLFLRRVLNWKNSPLDRFVAALVLGSLHGEMDKSQSYFSNQMTRTISTKPKYSLNYWRKNNLWPLKKNVFEKLISRAEFRLSGELPEYDGKVALGDARNAVQFFPELIGRIKMVITSPPYINVTNYEEDQWLRLWFLGNAPKPTYGVISSDDRHTKRERYWKFLQEVWLGIAPLLSKKAIFVCRLGGKGISKQELTRDFLGSILSVFPHSRLIGRPRVSDIKNRQTSSFQPKGLGCSFEIDYIFDLSQSKINCTLDGSGNSFLGSTPASHERISALS